MGTRAGNQSHRSSERGSCLRAEIDRAREEIANTRRELRAVQLELRQDIETLETWLRIVNIALVPVMLTLFALGIGVLRSRRRAASRA